MIGVGVSRSVGRGGAKEGANIFGADGLALTNWVADGVTKGTMTTTENSAAGALHRIYLDKPVVSGKRYKFAVTLKPDGRAWLHLNLNNSQTFRCYFNIAGMATGTNAGIDSAGVDDVGGGYYRCWLIFTSAATEQLYHQVRGATGNEVDAYNGSGALQFTFTLFSLTEV